MSPDDFRVLQEQLWIAFGYPIQWWIILFFVAGVGAAVLAFSYVLLGKWIEKT